MLNRFLKTIIVLCLVGIVGITFYSGALSARKTVFRSDYTITSGQALSFENPQDARKFLGELGSTGAATDFYAFKASKGTAVEIHLDIPRLQGLANFRPALVLFGPGLPTPDASIVHNLPFTTPQDSGLVLSQDDPYTTPLSTEVDEPFTQTGFWEGQSIARELPEDGTYYIAVFDPAGSSGKYALQVGDRSEPGLKEVLTFPWLWLRLRLWFDQEFWIIIIAAGLLAAAGLWYYFSIMRPSRSKPVG